MKKYVQIADLKSHLSEHLRSVRGGHPLIVMDRKTPIARIVPYEQGPAVIVIRKRKEGAPRFQDIPLPPPVDLGGVDLMKVLEEERADRDLLE
jgi:prevent-host-death family protein